MKRSAVLIAVWLLLAGRALATPGPGPGEPFGGEDAGCVPRTSAQLACADRVVRAFRTLITAVTRCHKREADARHRELFQGGSASSGDEACEAAAGVRFDKALASIASTGKCAGFAVLSTAAARKQILLGGASEPQSLDARNGATYCDATSTVPLDPGGDDSGFVPSTRDHLTCGDRVALGLARLEGRVLQCHRRAADLNYKLTDPAFDEDACEAKELAKFDAAAARLVARGICPACLATPQQHALGVAAVDQLSSANDAVYPCADDVLHPGALNLDRPTLMALGVQLLITGDDDHDAKVGVRYRAVGDPTWRNALPLMRVRPEDVPGRLLLEQFAGSIFDLRPSTAYEIELHAVDADGPVDQILTTTATTRAVPQDPVSPTLRPVNTVAELNAALAAAQPGDVISIANGTYVGPFVLEAGGTADNPIVIRGASTDGVLLDGGGCDACNVLETYGSFTHVEQLTLQSANRALRFQAAGAEGNVIRRVRTRDTRLGFAAREDQKDFYICDNDLEGRLLWPQVYTDDDGEHSNDDGILVQGNGHVVCHNRLYGFGDALKTEQRGARSLDFYGNEVLSAYDNGIELDEGEGNLRAWRNRFTNTYATISFQPVFGGPAYALRNIVVNVAHEQMKFHGLGSATGPSGVLVYHNTFVSPDMALLLETSVASHHFELQNNLFVGPATLTGTKTLDWLGPIDDGLFDYNGWFPDGVFRFNFPPTGLISYPSFAATQAAGIETHGVLLAPAIFANGLTAPASYTADLAPQDTTLAASSNAIDRGAVLFNVADGFTGSAPDLGALERGCPLPIYGVRPLGIDESNEPLGCNS